MKLERALRTQKGNTYSMANYRKRKKLRICRSAAEIWKQMWQNREVQLYKRKKNKTTYKSIGSFLEDINNWGNV